MAIRANINDLLQAAQNYKKTNETAGSVSRVSAADLVNAGINYGKSTKHAQTFIDSFSDANRWQTQDDMDAMIAKVERARSAGVMPITDEGYTSLLKGLQDRKDVYAEFDSATAWREAVDLQGIREKYPTLDYTTRTVKMNNLKMDLERGAIDQLQYNKEMKYLTDAGLYDLYTDAEAYDAEIGALKKEYDKLDERFRSINYAPDKTVSWSEEEKTALKNMQDEINSEMISTKRRVEALENQKVLFSRQKEIEAFNVNRQNADFAEKSKEYDKNLLPTEMNLILQESFEIQGYGATGGETHYRKPLGYQMNDEEVEMFTYLFNTQGGGVSDGYYNKLTPILEKRQSEQVAKWAKELYNETGWLGKITLATLDKITGVAGMVQQVAYGDNTLSVFTNAIRSETAESLTGWIENETIRSLTANAYLGLCSVADSIVGASLLTPEGYLALAGISTAINRADELYWQGASKGEIVIGSILSGVIEVAFEKLSIEKIIGSLDVKTGREWVKSVLAGTVIGASEEANTTFGNMVADAIVRGAGSDVSQRAFELERQGASALEAQKTAYKEAGINLLWDAFGGAVGGFTGNAGTATVGVMNARAEKRATQNVQRTHGLTDAVVNAAEHDATTAQPDLLTARNRTESFSIQKENGEGLANSADVGYTGFDNVDFEKLKNYRRITYNQSGWAIVNRVLTGNEQIKLFTQFADAEVNGFKYPKDENGDYLITVGDKYNDANKVVHIGGTNDNPIITKVVEIVPNVPGDMSWIRQQYIDMKVEGYDDVDTRTYVEGNYGEGVLRTQQSEDFADYGQLQELEKQGRSGANGIGDYQLKLAGGRNDSAYYAQNPANDNGRINQAAQQDSSLPSADGTGSLVAPSYTQNVQQLETVLQELGTLDNLPKAEKKAKIRADIAATAKRYGIADDVVDAISFIAERVGTRVIFVDQVLAHDGSAAEAKFDRKSNTIFISHDTSVPVYSVVKHELTHAIAGTELYDRLVDFVKHSAQMQELLTAAKTEFGVDEYNFEDYIKATIDDYASKGESLDSDGATEEIVAEFVADYLLNDQDTVTALFKSQQNVFYKLLYNLRQWSKRATLDADTKKLRAAEQLFVRAMSERGKRYYKSGLVDSKSKIGVADKFSIGKTTDGRPVAIVDDDILSEMDLTTWDKDKRDAAKKAASNALKKCKDGILVNGTRVAVNRDSRNEFTRSNSTDRLYRKNETVFADKMRSASVLNDIATATIDWKTDGELTHERSDKYVDFEKGDVLIAVGENRYSAKVVIAITQNGRKVFHDVSWIQPAAFQIKKAESPSSATTQTAIGTILGDSTDISVAQSPTDVNTQSMQDGEKYSIEGGDFATKFEARIKAYGMPTADDSNIESYQTSAEVRRLPWKARKAKYLEFIREQYRGRTAKFVRNGHVYEAEFDQSSIRKPLYGDNRSSRGGVSALTNVGADGKIFELVENSKYVGSKKNRKDHTSADYFDYFIKTVQIDGVYFDIVADVEKSYGKNGGYIYTISLNEKNKTGEMSHAQVSPEKTPVRLRGNNSPNISVAQSPTDVNTQSMQDGEKYSINGNDFETNFETRIKAYGALEQSPQAGRVVTLPKSIGGTDRVSQTAQTVAESVQSMPDEVLPDYKQALLEQAMSFDPMTNNWQKSYANDVIDRRGLDGALDFWRESQNDEGSGGAKVKALGAELLKRFAELKDYDAVMELSIGLITQSHNDAVSLQATRLIRDASPEWRVYQINKVIENVNRQNAKRQVKRKSFDEAEDLRRRIRKQKRAGADPSIIEGLQRDLNSVDGSLYLPRSMLNDTPVGVLALPPHTRQAVMRMTPMITALRSYRYILSLQKPRPTVSSWVIICGKINGKI